MTLDFHRPRLRQSNLAFLIQLIPSQGHILKSFHRIPMDSRSHQVTRYLSFAAVFHRVRHEASHVVPLRSHVVLAHRADLLGDPGGDTAGRFVEEFDGTVATCIAMVTHSFNNVLA